jgi:hypothetical protein
MSEGTFFHSAIPNITLYIGSYIIGFKNGRYPPRRDTFVTDQSIVDAIKSHDSYGKTVESEEDRQKRLTPDPKVVEDLQAQALERLKDIPGVVPSELMQSSPPEDPPTPKSQEQESEQLEQAPSLTEISRMNKPNLLEWVEIMNIEVTQGDTVAILRRKVKSWIKQNA